jgi:uroporphyrinogen-III synthase
VRLLVTRPEPEGARTAALLRSLGHEAIEMPMLRIEPIADADLCAGPWAAVLLTSANAVRAVAAHRRFREVAKLPAYAVGARTKAAAAAAGFAPVHAADGDVGALARFVGANLPATRLPLLYPAGEARAGDLAGTLEGQGFRVATVVIYRAATVEDFTPEVRDALAAGSVDAVLHYSARTAAAFLAAASRAGLGDAVARIRHGCLSAEVAAPLRAAGIRVAEVAREPNEKALLACLDLSTRATP